MSILTELRAALGRYQACHACRNSACIGCENDARIGEPMLYDLLIEAAPALLDVAEAAEELLCTAFVDDYRQIGSCDGCSGKAICDALNRL